MEIKNNIDMNLDRECIMLSYLAYHNRDEIANLNDGGELRQCTDECWKNLWDTIRINYEKICIYDCSDYNIGDTQFIYTIDKNERLIISFRGTKSLTDLITDIRFLKDKCVDLCYSPYYLKHFHNGTDIPYVHQGFYEMFNLMKLELYHIVRKYLHKERANYNILITGHSLGGSLSMIAAASIYAQFHTMITKGNLKIDNITFGSPKVGNYEFSRIYNMWIGKNCRHYYHNCDPIPYVPIMRFYPVENTIQINKSTDAGWLYSIQYHFLENYLKFL